MFLETMSNKI